MPYTLKLLFGASMIGVGLGVTLDWLRDFLDCDNPLYLMLAIGSISTAFGIYFIAG